ncbi:diacylglycerol kinase family protein [Novosphingobium sp. BL-8H]|uniref:diacylglycerol kinase family protein n=1 Tax=Novosphingobium sp. BL-8H TaxID=3127640 RepID=UPI003756648F
MVEPSDVLQADALPASHRFSVAARFRSFLYAWRGLRRLVQNEHNARLHLAVSLAVVAAGLFLKVSADDWRWLVLAMALVWLAEAFNTAIEELCDRTEPGFDKAIGRIKDVAAGAVLIASIAAAAIGLLTLGPPLLVLLGQGA